MHSSKDVTLTCMTKGRITHSMPCPCHAPIVPCPLRKSAWQPEISELLVQQFNRSSFLYCVATTLFLISDKRLVSHWPPASEIGMLLITFVELHVVTGRSQMHAGSPQDMLWRGTEKNGMGMASVNHIRLHCVNQMGKTQSKPLAARHGRGRACCVWNGLNRKNM